MSSSLATRLFGLLEGNWEILRVVASVGKLKGSAQFVKSPRSSDELLYSESGIFEFYESSNTFNASRKYIYRLSSEKDGAQDISVYFDDTGAQATDANNNDNNNNGPISQSVRLFHKFGLAFNQPSVSGDGSLKVYAVHLCAEDIYNVNYEFKLSGVGSGANEAASMDEFNIIYDVKGPKKNYVSETFFKRSNSC